MWKKKVAKTENQKPSSEFQNSPRGEIQLKFWFLRLVGKKVNKGLSNFKGVKNVKNPRQMSVDINFYHYTLYIDSKF